ncbi:hypothetical protein FZI94_16445 [Mycobacterium sp. CBMA226]|nr:hypothetical protein [Mycolicibacterium sp. CBMA 226]
MPHVRIGAAESIASGLKELGAVRERFPGIGVSDTEAESRQLQPDHPAFDDGGGRRLGQQHLCDVAGVAEQPDGAHRVAFHQLLDVVRDVRGGVQYAVGLVEDVVDLLAEARGITAVVVASV